MYLIWDKFINGLGHYLKKRNKFFIEYNSHTLASLINCCTVSAYKCSYHRQQWHLCVNTFVSRIFFNFLISKRCISKGNVQFKLLRSYVYTGVKNIFQLDIYYLFLKPLVLIGSLSMNLKTWLVQKYFSSYTCLFCGV